MFAASLSFWAFCSEIPLTSWSFRRELWEMVQKAYELKGGQDWVRVLKVKAHDDDWVDDTIDN